jgi:hypothetical protein
MLPRTAAALLLATGSLAVAPTPLPAQSPAVALVLEADGATPAVRPYREIRSGTTVTLGDRGRLVILMYASCRTLTVGGAGTVTFTAGPMPILKGAATRSDVRGQCPRKFAASASDAATILRTVTPSPLTTAARPEFVLVGGRAEDFGRATITRPDGAEVLTRALSGPHVTWPPNAPALAPGPYTLRLQPAAAGTAPVTVNFTASPQTPEAVTLITID